MKKLLFFIIASLAFWGNAIADDDLPENLPPSRVQAFSIRKTSVEILLNNADQLVEVKITDDKGNTVYQVITSSPSILINAKYLQKDIYNIEIIPLSS